jgi:hypothetical protein
MHLLIDAGNSRIKWAWSDGQTLSAALRLILTGLDAAVLAPRGSRRRGRTTPVWRGRLP